MTSSTCHCNRVPFVLTVALLSLSSLVQADPLYDSFFSNNGSFEFGSSNPPLTFSNNFSTNTTISGWTVGAGGVVPQWIQGAGAEDGQRYLELSATGGLAGWRSYSFVNGASNGQTPFTIGSQYDLTFWAAGGVGNINNVSVGITMLGNQSVTNFALQNYSQSQFDALSGLQWMQFTVPFVATDTTMRLDVAPLVNGTPGNDSTVYLDNFSIAAVPEPGSVLLAGMAGVMAITARRRRYASLS